jgi:hypothetical protein
MLHENDAQIVIRQPLRLSHRLTLVSCLPKQLLDRLAPIDQLHGATSGNLKGLMGIDAELGLEGHGEVFERW